MPKELERCDHKGNRDILAVIPAYNEQNNILKVIRAVQAELPTADILVINDCSEDRTGLVARTIPGVKVIDLPCNLGIGGAMQTGF